MEDSAEEKEEKRKRQGGHNGKNNKSIIKIYSFPILIIQDGEAGVTVYILSAQRYIDIFSLQIVSSGAAYLPTFYLALDL